MGKSPGKWIKSLLLKKSTKSHGSRSRDTSKATINRDYLGRDASVATDASSPVISDPVLVSTDGSGIMQEVVRNTSEAADTGGVSVSVKQDIQKPETGGFHALNDLQESNKEQAAIKAQSAFRGYLARRAFRALKGIIRLQAVVRGHLVRRQAVSTLRTMYCIVQFQSLVRGWKVRSSAVGVEVYAKYSRGNVVNVKSVTTWREKVSKSEYIRKYDEENSNSVMSWLERWSSMRFWKPTRQPKKAIETKSKTRRGNYAMETESGRSKRVVRKTPTVSTDFGLTNTSSEPEKSKRNMRRVSSSVADSVPDNPQSELEKVKRNLRRVANLATEQASDQPDENEKSNSNIQKVSSSLSDAPVQVLEVAAVKAKIDDVEKPNAEVVATPDIMADPESPLQLMPEEPFEVLVNDCPITESTPLPTSDKEDNILKNREMNSKAELSSHEIQKKRRSSFTAKSEYSENGLLNTPTLPSYMQATESAKAKLRGQSSPRFGSDSIEKNGYTRRHSLPCLANGKPSSHSPRTQRLVQAKGSAKGDRSLLSSRDGHDKPIQVEWRR